MPVITITMTKLTGRQTDIYQGTNYQEKKFEESKIGLKKINYISFLYM